jgi:hypothetical protein
MLTGRLDSDRSLAALAWSYAFQKQSRNPNDWREAQRFLDQITA